MAELTPQQIEFAVAAFENVAGHATTGELLLMAERMRRAAPFLQFQLDEPTGDEAEAIILAGKVTGIRVSDLRLLYSEFVRRRNASRTPQLVDPRIAKVVVILNAPWLTPEDRAVEILAVIDEVK